MFLKIKNIVLKKMNIIFLLYEYLTINYRLNA